MAVEILSVSLSDESIERLATAVAAKLGSNQVVTESNPPSPNLAGGGSGGLQSQGADPWGANQVSQQPQYQPQQQPAQVQPQQVPQPQQQTGGAPTCQHGQMRYVPAGFSQSSGKAYQAFYGCPAPRGTAQCRSVKAG